MTPSLNKLGRRGREKKIMTLKLKVEQLNPSWELSVITYHFSETDQGGTQYCALYNVVLVMGM